MWSIYHACPCELLVTMETIIHNNREWVYRKKCLICLTAKATARAAVRERESTPSEQLQSYWQYGVMKETKHARENNLQGTDHLERLVGGIKLINIL